MSALRAQSWMLRLLPFASAASADLPLGRLIRLSLFQVSVGMALVLINGTLNRVMIVELGVPAAFVALVISLPLIFAPLRALIGFRSDHHRSAIGWRRVPYIWIGSMLQFGGLAIMPFALLVLSGEGTGAVIYGQIGAALGFILIGAGLHTTQTAGLALATDLAPEQSRPKAVALLYVMLLVGMVISSILFGWLLSDFAHIKLIQVIQAAALLTVVLNTIALWKQEARAPRARNNDRPSLRQAWRELRTDRRPERLLIAVVMGTAGFSMQDILLEPYGAEILALSVSATTFLTALLAFGSLLSFALAAHKLSRGVDPHRLAAVGALVGVSAFSAVVFADALQSGLLFRLGTLLIGFGAGLFAVGTMVAAMDLVRGGHSGLMLGAWGAAQATAAGCAIALGGVFRDTVGQWAASGALGEALMRPSTGYSVVYHIEIALLFAALVAIGPLVRRGVDASKPEPFELAQFPH